MMGMICLALLATSCRRLPVAPPTGKPSVTPTPRSTALPPVATLVPLGVSANPLHIEFVALSDAALQRASRVATAEATENAATAEATSESLTGNAATDLGKALSDEMQMSISIDVVDNDSEALAALCDSPKGTVSAAWLSGLAYAAAFAQECGSAAAQVQYGTSSDATTGDEARIIIKSDSKIGAIADLKDGRIFCRLGYSDVYSWLIPSLMLHNGGVEDSDLKAITDYDDPSMMIADVAAGKCDAAGISGSQFDALASPSKRISVRTLQKSATIPYAVLVIPPQLPLAQQQQLSAALIALSKGTRASIFKSVLNQDQVIPATDDDFSSLRSFLNGVGIDLSQAGS
jgi:ABC-type phosphate/phosphonate transport system substrate-binding protein